MERMAQHIYPHLRLRLRRLYYEEEPGSSASDSRRCGSTIGEAMDLILLLWSHSAPGRQEKLPANQKGEEDLSREKVSAWLKTQ